MEGNREAMARAGDPWAGRGQSVGLLGGSFDPAHEGHAQISREALRRFGLDWVWWLVSPGNPLKRHGPAPLAARIARARDVIDHPRVRVTGIEARLGTSITAEVLPLLRARYPHLSFVWLMGADNLAQFHRWQDWQSIMDSVPVGVLARPGLRARAQLAPAARAYRFARIKSGAAPLLARADPPAWCFLDLPLRPESSTALRASGAWSSAHDPAEAG